MILWRMVASECQLLVCDTLQTTYRMQCSGGLALLKRLVQRLRLARYWHLLSSSCTLHACFQTMILPARGSSEVFPLPRCRGSRGSQLGQSTLIDNSTILDRRWD